MNISDIITSFGATNLLDYMNEYWKTNSGSDETFWEHEWGKHGTCISTLEPHCYNKYKPTEEVVQYFNRTVGLFQNLPSYQWLAEIQAALGKNRDRATVYLGCTGGNKLDEIWYFFNVRGSLQEGTFIPDNSLTDSSCPSTGIRYLPKGTKATPTSATSTAATATSTSTGLPFSGKGYIYINGTTPANGFMISGGKWYTAGGTPATYRGTYLDDAGTTFTMTTSKGPCYVADDMSFSCAAGNPAGNFTRDGSTLTYAGGNDYFYSMKPNGQDQATVYTVAGEGHEMATQLEWLPVA